MKPKVHAANREEWRRWLKANHAEVGEAWLVYYKKHTGKPTVSYPDSVKEALCFGWIDGLKKRIDDETYAHRFTPRRPASKWSPLNIKLANMMIEKGKMTEAGLRAFNQRKTYDEKLLKAIDADHVALTAELESRLKANSKAWDNFNRLAPGYRKQYVGWLISAQKPETREKRIQEAISLLSKNRKLGMK